MWSLTLTAVNNNNDDDDDGDNCCVVNPVLTPAELAYFCVGFVFWLGALIHVSFYLCIDLSLYLILRVLSLIGQLAFTDMCKYALQSSSSSSSTYIHNVLLTYKKAVLSQENHTMPQLFVSV